MSSLLSDLAAVTSVSDSDISYIVQNSGTTEGKVTKLQFLADVAFASNTPPILSTGILNYNDYSPGSGVFQRWASDGAGPVIVSGMLAGRDGEFRLIWNVSNNPIHLTDSDSNSQAANQFNTATEGTLHLNPHDCALAIYDLASAKWRIALFPFN